MKPHSRANASSTLGGWVRNYPEQSLMPCRCRPVLSAEYGSTCSSKLSSQSCVRRVKMRWVC